MPHIADFTVHIIIIIIRCVEAIQTRNCAIFFFKTGMSTVFGGTQCNCHQCQNKAVCSYNNTCDCIEDYVGDTCSERYSERCGGLVMCQNGAECVYDEGGRIVRCKMWR